MGTRRVSKRDELAVILLTADGFINVLSLAPAYQRRRYRALAVAALTWFEQQQSVPSAAIVSADVPTTPSLTPDELADGWNLAAAVPFNLPKVLLPLAAERRKRAAMRVKQYPDPETWQQVFAAIGASKFLRGTDKRRPDDAHAHWRCTFDWLIANDVNPAKVLEGQYADNRHRP